MLSVSVFSLKLLMASPVDEVVLRLSLNSAPSGLEHPSGVWSLRLPGVEVRGQLRINWVSLSEERSALFLKFMSEDVLLLILLLPPFVEPLSNRSEWLLALTGFLLPFP